MGTALAAVIAVLLSLAVVAVTAVLLRKRVRRWLARELRDLAGPSIVAALPPRVVLSSLLEKIYGRDSGFEAVLAGVLGGAGSDPDGRDLAVSRHTTAHFRLRTIGDSTCSTVATWTHRLSGAVDDHNFAVFVTCDSATFNLILTERLIPLYESWLVDDEDLLEEVVPRLQDSLEVGITYTDDTGVVHDLQPRYLNSMEIALRDYSRFVRLPDEVDRKNLRILLFDLGELFDIDHVVGGIEGLSLRFETLGTIGDGFMYWSPPYPCLVERITFDVADLVIAQGDLVFKVIPFTMAAFGPRAGPWGTADEVRELALDSWFLPGHGVTLLWKPADQVNSIEARR